MLWPSGPLSSDCHSWGLRDRFLRRSHSSKLTPPTKHCLLTPTSPHAICPDRWKDMSFETNLLPLICPFFLLGSLINHFPPLMLSFYIFTTTSCCFTVSSTCLFLKNNPRFPFHHPIPTPLPFTLAFEFIYLDLFHLRANNPLTGSFIRMTSSNPFVAVGWINPAYSLALTEFIMKARIHSG